MTWPIVKLGDEVTIKGGGTPSRHKPEFYQGDIPWATIKDLTGLYLAHTQEHITKEALDSSATNLIPTGNVILATRVGLGKVAVNTIDVAINQDLKALFCSPRLAPKYLAYYLSSLAESIERQGVGATVKGITLKQIENWPLPLPPLSEQRRSVEILDQADALRQKRAEAGAKADRILLALFYKMFGNMSKNPMGWDIQPVKSFAKVQGGLQISSKRAENPIEMPYLRVANVYRDKLDLSEVKHIKVTEAEAKRVALRKDDILVVEGHGNRDEIGRSAVWDGSINPCLHQNHLICVRTDKIKAEPDYVSSFLNSPEGRKQLFRFGKTTSGLNTISVSNVEETLIALPPIAKQRVYVEQVKRLQAIKETLQNRGNRLETLFHILLHRAFSGDLTAQWREAHMQELLTEMREQAKTLQSNGARNSDRQLSLYP
jgi:type I restriction enzyme S subunit